MTKQPQRLDDYDAFDERGVLRDGKRWTVSMSFMDSMQRSVAQHFAKSPKMGDITTADHHIDLHDGHGRQPGNRPGWVMPTDQLFDSKKQEAYEQYDKQISTAYLDADNASSQTGAGSGELRGAQAGDICTCRGPEFPDDFGSPGTMQMYQGKLTCVPNQPRGRSTPARPLPRNDVQDVQAVQARHRENMKVLRDQLDRSLADAWRTAR